MNKLASLNELTNLYNSFETKNKNSTDKNIRIIVGMATCGIAAGADETFKALKLEIEKKSLKNIQLIKSGCLGSCFVEPTVVVEFSENDKVLYGNVTEDKVSTIIEEHIVKGNVVKELEIKKTEGVRIALRNCGYIDPENINDYIKNEGYLALGKALTNLKSAEVIDIIKKSGLRGRGGGGFLTGLKWELAANVSSDKKYIICNADEGDPGAFMDRSILEGDPHSVLEAMIIAGFAVGSDSGYIYIRAEYPLAIKRLKIAIDDAKNIGLLGENILNSGFSFNIDIRFGAGAFVCGEETSLIHSIEGNRGEPTFKPPFPTEKGLFEKPTVVNNVETFANVATIILKGHEWFSSIGTLKSKGTKVFALAGKVNNVGLIEVPMGTSLREIIFEIGGGIVGNKEFKAVQTGGPSGGCIPQSNLDTPIDYDSLTQIGTMMGSGGMIVLDETDCMVNVAKFYLQFTMDESCGKCTACRIGNKRLYEILCKITSGNGTIKDLEMLKELGEIIKDTALCGLGQTSPNPVLSTLTHFYDEYLAHVNEKRCPAGVCSSLLRYKIISDKCIGCTACTRVCPSSCITGEVKKPHIIDQVKCIKCGVCFETCKFKAIEKK